MNCQNSEGCLNKYIQWKNWQNDQIPAGENLHAEIIRNMDNNGDFLSMSQHANRREFYRAYSSREIKTGVKHGWVIEHNPKRKTLHILHNFKVGKATYRPIHVVLGYDGKWKIITVYDPRSKAWKWDRSFQERVCFCK